MSNYPIGNPHSDIKRIPDILESRSLNAIRHFLTDALILRACRAAGYAKWRLRLLSPVVVVLHFIMTAMWREESFQGAFKAFWDTLAGILPGAAGQRPSSGTVCKSRYRVPLGVFEHVFGAVCEMADEMSEKWAYWRGMRVVLVDGTTVSMPDTPELTAEFGKSTGQHGESKFPLASIVTLALANTRTIVDYAVGRYVTGENALLKTILPTLQDGDLLIGDRRFAGMNLYCLYMRHGLNYLTRLHQRTKVKRLKVLQRYSADDMIVRMHPSPAHQRADETLPNSIAVRLIRLRVRVRGKRETMWIATNLLDNRQYPAKELATLYCNRWRIETLYDELKIGMDADVLRSMKPDGIYKEIASKMTALNLVRLVILDAADAHDIEDPLRVSFLNAVRSIIHFSAAMSRVSTASLWRLNDIYEAMLTEIAHEIVPWRPGRVEPRAIRRETKHYPSLKQTRGQWRMEQVI